MILTNNLLSGTIQIPPSKSMMQRVLLAAFLSDSPVSIINPGIDKDSQALLAALQILGLTIKDSNASVLKVASAREKIGTAEISVGESGLACRMILPFLATRKHNTILNGKGSLLTRPMDFVVDILNRLEARIDLKDAKFLPAQISGRIKANEFHVDGSQSSQHITGMLYALTQIEGDSIMHVENMVSTPYIELTLNVLKHFGIKIDRNKSQFKVSGIQNFRAERIEIEGDWSGAANWFVAAALGHDLEIAGLSFNSIQADKAIVDAIESTGCIVRTHKRTFRVEPADELLPFEFDASNCPDLFPPLVVLAAKCNGVSRIKGISRLVHKESNRYLSLQTEYKKLGITISKTDDWMIINGGTMKPSTKVLDSWNDHRIAMALAISCLDLEKEMQLEGSQAVSKSYPSYWADLDKLKSKSV